MAHRTTTRGLFLFTAAVGFSLTICQLFEVGLWGWLAVLGAELGIGLGLTQTRSLLWSTCGGAIGGGGGTLIGFIPSIMTVHTWPAVAHPELFPVTISLMFLAAVFCGGWVGAIVATVRTVRLTALRENKQRELRSSPHDEK